LCVLAALLIIRIALHNILPTVFMLYSSKEYINGVEQVVKIFEDGLCLFHCSYYKFLEGTFASKESIKPFKMCKNQNMPFQYSSPVVHSTPPEVGGVYKWWNGLLDWNIGMDYRTGIFLVFTHF